MEKEYYIGYLRNPKQVISNGFQDIEEFEVILEKDYDDYREVCLREKVYLMKKNEIFDGHQILKNQAGLIGRIGKKITQKEAMNLITTIRETRMEEYVEQLRILINDTREMLLEGEKEYQQERKKFADNYNVNIDKINDKITFKRM